MTVDEASKVSLDVDAASALAPLALLDQAALCAQKALDHVSPVIVRGTGVASVERVAGLAIGSARGGDPVPSLRGGPEEFLEGTRSVCVTIEQTQQLAETARQKKVNSPESQPVLG
jgi:hypothetical protein